MKFAGLVLAAGAGRRLGGPKALVRDPYGVTWVVRTSRLLADAGCDPVLVVIGAAADQVRPELAGEPVRVVEETNWDEGMGASLRAGLTALQADAAPGNVSAEAGPGRAGTVLAGRDEVDAVLLVPVDLPGLSVDVIRRVAASAGARELVRAVYGGVPGHPVGIGREHWEGVIASARGDAGARWYLREHAVGEIECSDLGDGADVDTVDELPPGHG